MWIRSLIDALTPRTRCSGVQRSQRSCATHSQVGFKQPLACWLIHVPALSHFDRGQLPRIFTPGGLNLPLATLKTIKDSSAKGEGAVSDTFVSDSDCEHN